jgi:hypothetical protein
MSKSSVKEPSLFGNPAQQLDGAGKTLFPSRHFSAV